MNCKLRRAHYTTQAIPFDAAPVEYAKLDEDLITAWCQITDISRAEIEIDPNTMRRLRLPYRRGGQGLPAIADIADAALIATWAKVAQWTEAQFGAPAAIINASKCTRDAHLQAAFTRLRENGPEVEALLPPSIDGFIHTEYKNLQRDITHVKDDNSFKEIHTKLAKRASSTKPEAAQMLSVSGPGALDWHAQCPYSKDMQLPSPIVSIAIRLELYLDQPGLTLEDVTATCCNVAGCSTHVFERKGHHAINCKYNNQFGSRTRCHNDVLWQLIKIVKQGTGLHATPKCAALLGPNEHARNAKDRDHDNITDICVTGLRNDVIAVLGDVSIVHPIEGVKPYACASGTATEEGAAVRRLEQKKNNKYKPLATEKHFLFIAMCMETYGRFGPDFIAFLTTIAEIAAKRNEDLRSVPTTRSMRQQFITRQLRRYMRQLHLYGYME